MIQLLQELLVLQKSAGQPRKAASQRIWQTLDGCWPRTAGSNLCLQVKFESLTSSPIASPNTATMANQGAKRKLEQNKRRLRFLLQLIAVANVGSWVASAGLAQKFSCWSQQTLMRRWSMLFSGLGYSPRPGKLAT